jgi:hypothetical protein
LITTQILGSLDRSGGRLSHQLADAVRELSALADPVIDTVTLDFYRSRGGTGIVGADHLYRAAVTGTILLDDNDAVMGLLAGANARQTDHQHCKELLKISIYVGGIDKAFPT